LTKTVYYAIWWYKYYGAINIMPKSAKVIKIQNKIQKFAHDYTQMITKTT